MKKAQRGWSSLTASLGFVALGVVALWGTGELSPLGSVFPRAIGSAMILFAVMDIVWWWFGRPCEAQSEGSNLRRVVLAAIMLLWALLLQTLGFWVTSLAASLLLMLVANHEPWTRRRALGYVVSTLAVVAGLYSVFAFVLEVPLPGGILF